jgi:5-methylcytosine-specific restriction endonuclease McrA
MLRNVKIATDLGCFDEAGLNDMRQGQSPTVRRGPYKGQELTVDHIIPYAVAPELGNVIANLELLPWELNLKKGTKFGQRQRDLVRRLFAAGLLSQEGWKRLRVR